MKQIPATVIQRFLFQTMQIKDEGDIESFRDIIQDWVNEDLQGWNWAMKTC